MSAAVEPHRLAWAVDPKDTGENRGERSAPDGLPAAWRALAVQFRAWGAMPQAVAVERCAEELEAALGAEAGQLLTLAEASRLSGYSRDHVARLVRSGAIPNAGRPNAPRVRRADVPRKAAVASGAGALHLADAGQVARAVVSEGRR